MSFSFSTPNPLILKHVQSDFCGAKIIVSALASSKEAKQVRFPRSKRKRIRRKWKKDRRNWISISKPGIWQLSNGSIIMDPLSYLKLQESLRKAQPTPPSPLTMEGFLDDLRSITRPTRSPSLFDRRF